MATLDQDLDEDEVLTDYFVLIPKEQGPVGRFVSGAIDKMREKYQRASDKFYQVTGW